MKGIFLSNLYSERTGLARIGMAFAGEISTDIMTLLKKSRLYTLTKYKRILQMGAFGIAE
ncbi:MAG: hypothetical protein ACFFE6_12030 [Candidatus Thorarchaeota archaeon]